MISKQDAREVWDLMDTSPYSSSSIYKGSEDAREIYGSDCGAS